MNIKTAPNRLAAITVICVMVLFSSLLHGAPPPPQKDPGKLPLPLPGAVIKNMEFNPALDLYEVVTTDGNLLYLTKDQKHIIIGNVLELPSMKNLTEEKKAAAFKVDFAKIPLDKAIKLTDGQKKIAVFTSPNCPWCRKLHQELKKLDGVAVYAFVVPYGSIDKIKSIMCAPNKQQAFEKAYSGADLPSINNCNYQGAEIAKLAKSLYINAYPTIITDDGRRISGYLPSDKLSDAIFKTSQKTAQRGKN